MSSLFQNPAFMLFWPALVFVIFASVILIGVMIHNNRQQKRQKAPVRVWSSLIKW